MRIRILLPLIAIAALGVAGCGSSKKKSTATTTPAATSTTAKAKPMPAKHVGAPGAKISFITPKQGATVGEPIVVKVKVTNFVIDPKAVGKAAVQGHGHLHFSMDGGKYDFPKYSGQNGALAVGLGVQGKYSPSVMPTITYKNLPKGKHTLEVYLANNDHSNTGVEAKETFTVK